MKTLARRVALLALVVTTIGCDRVTKQVASATLQGVPTRSFLADTLRLQYAENDGAFLNVGVGTLRTGIFNVADVAILLGVVALALAREPAIAGRDGPA